MDNDLNNLSTKRGYLNEDFKFFHLKDQKKMQFESHYHDFNKILIFISGNVTYLIEGKAYKLRPLDIILVNNSEIHKPIIQPDKTYERIIIWVNSAFLEKHNSSSCDLLSCFKSAYTLKYNLLRFNLGLPQKMQHVLLELEKACKSIEFGSKILQNSLFVQFVVYLNREFFKIEKDKKTEDIKYDKTINKILDFINENLANDLSIDNLASKFYINKYYLMHKFKKQTGYTIHNYILQKRLIKASSLIKKQKPAMEVSLECGFGNYSNFVKAFKKMFGLSPRKYYQNEMELKNIYNNTHHL